MLLRFCLKQLGERVLGVMWAWGWEAQGELEGPILDV